MTATAILAKSCNKCSENKPRSEFYKATANTDGLRSQCKACALAAMTAAYAANPDKKKAAANAYRMGNRDKVKSAKAAYRKTFPEKIAAQDAAYRAANPEKVKASVAAYRASNPDRVRATIVAWRSANAKRVKSTLAAYYAANAEKIKVINAAWARANPEKVRAYANAWAQAHPESRRINDQNRRARERSSGGKLSKDLAGRLFKLQRGLCACGCGGNLREGFHIDHVQPLALGGANEDSNCQLLTPKCNLSKGAKCPIGWAQSRGFLL